MWKLIEKVDANPLRVIDEIEKMKRDGVVDIIDGKLILTNRGREEMKKLKIKYVNVKCEECGGRGYKRDPFNILKNFKEIIRDRPKPIKIYDQGHISPEDIMRRVSFIYERGDLESSQIIIIGDDDLLGIALGLTNMPAKIEVLEIDPRLIDFINNVAKKYHLKLHAQKYDIRNPINNDLKGKFDSFITDPVETIKGISLFLSRGASALKTHGSGYFGLTHIEASLGKWREIEQILINMNFAITDMLRDFSTYPTKNNLEIFSEDYIITRKIYEMTKNRKIDANFYRSTFIRVEAVGEIEPLIRGKIKIEKEIYVDDESIVTALAMGD